MSCWRLEGMPVSASTTSRKSSLLSFDSSATSLARRAETERGMKPREELEVIVVCCKRTPAISSSGKRNQINCTLQKLLLQTRDCYIRALVDNSQRKQEEVSYCFCCAAREENERFAKNKSVGAESPKYHVIFVT